MVMNEIQLILGSLCLQMEVIQTSQLMVVIDTSMRMKALVVWTQRLLVRICLMLMSWDGM